MKITICCSASHASKAREIQEKLTLLGHEAFLFPQEIEFNGRTMSIIEWYQLKKSQFGPEIAQTTSTLIDLHFEKIRNSDAILVLNLDKNGIDGYIGGNTFLEMGIARFLKKKIFLWKSASPKLPYFEEIASMSPMEIGEEIQNIKQNV